MLKQTFIIFQIFCLTIQTGNQSTTQLKKTNTMKSNQAKFISSKNEVNHLNRKQITGQEVTRNTKKHKMIHKEPVEKNNYDVIAEENSAYLKNLLQYSESYKVFTNFSKIVVQIQQENISTKLMQNLEETLTKFLTLASQTFIGQRQDQFFYLYSYELLKSFLVDLQNKKAIYENNCTDKKNYNNPECKYDLSNQYQTLYEHFNSLKLAQVTSPEFKDKYEELIDQKYVDNLDLDQINKRSQQYQKNIKIQSEKNLSKYKTLINSLFTRKNNVISSIFESQLIKNKTYDNIFTILNNRVYVRDSKDYQFNFYSYHFIDSLEDVLNGAFLKEKGEKIGSVEIPFRCYVYEKSKVENLLNNSKALIDFLSIQNNKKNENLLENVIVTKNFYENLDQNYSDFYVLEQIKDFHKQYNFQKEQNRMVNNKNVTTQKIQQPIFQQKKLSQKLQPNLKQIIINKILGFQKEVPRSKFVKEIVQLRKNYEESNLNNQQHCERSFYSFLEAAADLFIGSEILDYKGEELQIYSYIYRHDFYDKLQRQIEQFKQCLESQDDSKEIQLLREKLFNVIEKFNSLHRLNHDYVELETQFNIAAIRKKLNNGILPSNSQISENEKLKIEEFKKNLKNDFYQKKGIIEKPNQETNLYQSYQEKTNYYIPVKQKTMEDQLIQRDSSEIEEEEENQSLLDIEKIHSNSFDKSFQRDSQKIEINSDEQAPKKIKKFSIFNDISDEQIYEKPTMQIDKLSKSKMFSFLNNINNLDQNNTYINQFTSYKKQIYFLILAINQVNKSVKDNSYKDGEKGQQIVLKYPKKDINNCVEQLKTFQKVVDKIYSIESDNMYILINSFFEQIEKDLHERKSYFYEMYFEPNQENQQVLDEPVKNAHYQLNLNIDQIEFSKLHPIVEQLTHKINIKLNNNIQTGIEDIDTKIILGDFEKTFNDLIRVDNLKIKRKFNSKKKEYINYGVYKYDISKLKLVNKNIEKLIVNLKKNNDEISQEIIQDLLDLQSFFINLKQTRAFKYEITNAQFNDNKNFIKFSSDQISFSSNKKESQESYEPNFKSQKNLNEDTSEEQDTLNSNNGNDKLVKNYQKNLPLKKVESLNKNAKQSIKKAQKKSRSQLSTSNENQVLIVQDNSMNLEKIKFSKLYKPLLNIQNNKIKNQQFAETFIKMANNFNQMVSFDNLVQISFRKIKKQRFKVGSYHFPTSSASEFLNNINALLIQTNQIKENKELNSDLKSVLNLFNSFLHTRKFYHEAFQAVLVNDKNEEISKPLYDFDINNIQLSDFSSITDNGLDNNQIINKDKNITDISEEKSEQQESSNSQDFINTLTDSKNTPPQIEEFSKEQSKVQKNIPSQKNSSKSQSKSKKKFSRNFKINKKSDSYELNPNKKISSSTEEHNQNKKKVRKIYVVEVNKCSDCLKNGNIKILYK